MHNLICERGSPKYKRMDVCIPAPNFFLIILVIILVADSAMTDRSVAALLQSFIKKLFCTYEEMIKAYSTGLCASM